MSVTESDIRQVSNEQLIEMVRDMAQHLPPVAVELANRLEESTVRLSTARHSVGTEQLGGILDGSIPVDTTVGVADHLAAFASTVDDPSLRAMLEGLAEELVAPTRLMLPAAA